MGFNEFYREALEKRGLALASRKFAIKMKNDAIKKRDEMEMILFGDSANYGVVSIVQMYYRLILLGSGKQTSTPSFSSLATAKAQYIAQFIQSVTIAGDGAGGLHPPDPDAPSMGVEDVDPNSVWLTTFSLESTPTGTGIAQRADQIVAQIGVTAARNSDNRGPFATLPLAQAEVAASRGSGLFGLRTENSEIVNTAGVYTVGQNGIDARDTFSSKTAFMSALNAMVLAIQAWIGQMTEIEGLFNGNMSAILTEYKVDKPEADLAALAALKTTANGYIAMLNDYITYFDAFSDTTAANRDDFENQLNSLKSFVQTVKSAVNARCDAIPALLGDASSGTKKHLAFWITDIAKKPDGPYAMLAMAESIITTSISKIQTEDAHLAFFEQDKGKWMETPNPIMVFESPVLNLDKTIKEKRITVSWGTVNPANRYRVWTKTLAAFLEQPTNEAWNGNDAWIKTVNPASGFLENNLVLPSPTQAILARVASYDSDEGGAGDLDRMDDAGNSNSPQTDVIGDALAFTQSDNVMGGTVIEVGEGILKEGDYLLLNNTRVCRVLSISENKVLLDGDYGAVSSVKQLFGFFQPMILEPVVISDD